MSGIFGIAIASAWTGVASADPPFTEEATERGVVYVPTFAGTAGNGVAFVDLDGDGDPDLVAVGAANGTIGLFENDGNGYFTSRVSGSGLPSIDPSDASGVTAADYDNDGDLDLYFANFGMNRLLRNDGNFTFQDVTILSGVGDVGNATGCGWADFDLDGFLDVYVGNLDYGSPFRPNALYRNLGNGTFENLAAAFGVDEPGAAWHALFLDYDRDGDADIYVSNDKGITHCDIKHNHLFRNDNGAYVDVTDETNTYACADSMGVAVGDFDANGFIDLYCTNIPEGNPLMLQQENGVFIDWTKESGVGGYEVGWGAHFLDIDHDGHLELYLCNFLAPNMLFNHDGVWPAKEIGGAMGLSGNDNGLTYCLAVADIDGDGDLDILSQDNNAQLQLYINHVNDTRQSIRFDVMHSNGTRDAIGALVDVRTGDQWQMREVTAGSNFKSQNELMIHVGVNDASIADEVIVTWPGGVTRTLTQLATGHRWTIHHPDRLGDADHDGDKDLDDFNVFLDCHGAPFAPGCEIMDFDGDSDVDDDDFALFVVDFYGPSGDCNSNGVIDLLEIVHGDAQDDDGNGLPDTCEPRLCDLDDDGYINMDDLLILLAAWGPCDDCVEDINNDHAVGMYELTMLFEHWD